MLSPMLTLDLGDLLRQHYRRFGDLVDAIDASVMAQDWPHCVELSVALDELLRKQKCPIQIRNWLSLVLGRNG